MSQWRRVSRRFPCRICDKDDWCGYVGSEDDPTACVCMRVESDKPAKNGGWLHVLRHDGPTWASWKRTYHVAAGQLQPEPAAIDFGRLAEHAAAITPSEPLQRLAGGLGVSVDSLQRLSVGWLSDRRAWGFPMRDHDGRVVGIRLRLAGGRKLSVRGGREGLFLPAGLEAGCRLLICEGPTDCAALLDLGFSAIGRPSCSGGLSHIIALVGRLTPDDLVIVADADGPGQRGACGLAGRLLAYVPTVRVITPPVKDAREWVRNGATAADVDALIAATPAKTLKIRVSQQTKPRVCDLAPRG